ncbi:MAG: sulfatase-like hydrolase/transferase, partial [Verrucomicrobiae bacterium]|nr:sulfatase-like hydrolase/transferase [Verrucomicrobiae bacterium]
MNSTHVRNVIVPMCVFRTGFFFLLTISFLSGAEKPNILLILADDLGWSDLGCYGNELIDTPNIDGLAKQGMRFTDAYAMPVCTPTRVSIQSGKNPATLKIQHPNPHNRPWGKLTTPRQYWRLPLAETTLAEALASNGYTSYHVGKWGSGYSRQAQGYATDPSSRPTGSYSALVENFEKNNPQKRIGPFLRQAVCFIEENRDRPFFCMFSPLQVHTGLEARDDLIEKYNLRFSKHRTSIHPIYAAMVEALDESVGIFMRVLEELKLSDNTVVVFCSDNGGVLNERGYVPAGWEENVTDNWPLRSEKGSLYEGGI